MVDSGAEWEAKRCEIRSATAEVKTGRLKILVLPFWMGEWKRGETGGGYEILNHGQDLQNYSSSFK